MSHGWPNDGDFRILPDEATYRRRSLLAAAIRRMVDDTTPPLALSRHRGLAGCFVASRPLAAFGGCEFRYSPSIEDLLEQDVDAIATDMRRALGDFLSSGETLQPQAVAARKLAEWVLDRGGLGRSTPIVIGVEMHRAHGPMLVVETTGLRDDLLIGRIEAAGFGMADLNIHLLACAAKQRHRSRLRAQATEAGATAWVDEFALHVVDRCGLLPSTVADLVDADEELAIEIGIGDDALATSFLWNEGVLGIAFSGEHPLFEFQGRSLTIDCAGVPDTALALLPGRSLRSLIDHPLLPARSRILDIRNLGGAWKIVTLDSEPRPLIGDARVPLDGRDRAAVEPSKVSGLR